MALLTPSARARSRHRRAERGIFRPAAADNGGTEMHGMSVFGDLKYPADFKHFDYVNPDAPKGGVVFDDPVELAPTISPS